MLEDYQGEEFRISDFQGRETVLFFWSSTCASCIKKLPEVKEFANRNEGKINLVAIDVYSDPGRIRELIGDDPGAVTFLHGLAGMAERYNLSATPTFYILDENGIIKGKSNSFADVLKLE